MDAKNRERQTVSTTMTKKRKQRMQMATTPAPKEHAPKPRRYSPPQCSSCTAIRPADKDYTSVYSVKRESEYTIRFCKCGYCGNTFKDTEKNG